MPSKEPDLALIPGYPQPFLLSSLKQIGQKLHGRGSLKMQSYEFWEVIHM